MTENIPIIKKLDHQVKNIIGQSDTRSRQDRLSDTNQGNDSRVIDDEPGLSGKFLHYLDTKKFDTEGSRGFHPFTIRHINTCNKAGDFDHYHVMILSQSYFEKCMKIFYWFISHGIKAGISEEDRGLSYHRAVFKA